MYRKVETLGYIEIAEQQLLKVLRDFKKGLSIAFYLQTIKVKIVKNKK